MNLCVRWQCLWVSCIGCYVHCQCVQVLHARENIDKIDEFLINFPIRYFSTKANVALATVSSTFYPSNFSQCGFVNIFPCQKIVQGVAMVTSIVICVVIVCTLWMDEK